ncbi:hypothetical protein GCM10018782_58710 [Streptomyces griseoaurantiacus]|nr:hypothetical protein GCM10018782_58710 [Streptomyces griseoaurantiacus]
MIRGLVSATNAFTRAPNEYRTRLLSAPGSPAASTVRVVPPSAGRDSTAVTHTPDMDIKASHTRTNGG